MAQSHDDGNIQLNPLAAAFVPCSDNVNVVSTDTSANAPLLELSSSGINLSTLCVINVSPTVIHVCTSHSSSYEQLSWSQYFLLTKTFSIIIYTVIPQPGILSILH